MGVPEKDEPVKEEGGEVASQKLVPKDEAQSQVVRNIHNSSTSPRINFTSEGSEEVVTQPKLAIAKPKRRKHRFHFTQVQAELFGWFILCCCCCWPFGAYALLCACQAKVAEDDEEYEKRLVWSTWLGLAGLIFNILVWPAVILLAMYAK